MVKYTKLDIEPPIEIAQRYCYDFPQYDEFATEILRLMLGYWKEHLFNCPEGETLHEEHTRASKSEGYLMAIENYCEAEEIPVPDHLHYAETFELRPKNE